MKKAIVILHGWKKTGAAYSDLKALFEKKGFIVYVPDLPGFGNTKLPSQALVLDDYVEYLHAFVMRMKIHNMILIGHSFGGRVAAKFTAKNPKYVDKLILSGAPLIKQPLSLRKKMIVTAAKTGRTIFSLVHVDVKRMRKVVYYLLGEWDYYKANQLKETLRNILQEDIAPNLPFIRTPTLVLWGEKDTFVSKKVGKEIARRIPHASYKEITDGTHKLPYEDPKRFADSVLKFIM